MLTKVIDLLEREGGHVLVLAILSFVGIVIYLHVGDWRVLGLFAPPLLLAMKGGGTKPPSQPQKEP